MEGGTAIIDDLLCYISCKLDVMPCDELLSVCMNSFTEKAITESKLCLFNACKRGPSDIQPTDGIKYKKRNSGPKRMENELTDIITLFQELGTTAPKFAAVNLNDLPSPSMDKLDIKSLLQSIELLRREVSTLNSMVKTQQQAIFELQKTAAEKPVVSASYADAASAVVSPATIPTTQRSNIRRRLPPAGGTEGNRVTKKRTFNAGQRTTSGDGSNPKFIGVKRIKTAELFVTRLSHDLESDEVKAFIYANLNLEVKVEKIDNSRKSVNFSSFHISCVCDDPKVFYDPKLWPQYALYRRWYPPRLPRKTN